MLGPRNLNSPGPSCLALAVPWLLLHFHIWPTLEPLQPQKAAILLGEWLCFSKSRPTGLPARSVVPVRLAAAGEGQVPGRGQQLGGLEPLTGAMPRKPKSHCRGRLGERTNTLRGEETKLQGNPSTQHQICQRHSGWRSSIRVTLTFPNHVPFLNLS